MRTLMILLVLLGSVGVAVAAGAAEGPIDLTPRFVEGRAATYEVWTLRETNNRFEGRGQETQASTTMEVTGRMTWTVQRVRSDGSAVCVMVYDWLAVDVTGPGGQTQTCDSRKSKGDIPPLQAVLAALTNKELTCQVAADGVVESIKGVDAIKNAVGDQGQVPKELDFIEAASDLAVLPAAPEEVELGDDWDAAFTWTHEMGLMHHDTEFELTSIEQVAGLPLATVTATSDLRFELDKDNLPGPDGPKVDVKLLEGEEVEQVLWDLSRHEAVGRNAVTNTVLRVTLSFDGNKMTRTITERIQSQALRVGEE